MAGKLGKGKIGRPPKVAGGLDKVLLIRADAELIRKLDELRDKQAKENRGIVLSRADVARSLLWNGIEQKEEEEDR